MSVYAPNVKPRREESSSQYKIFGRPIGPRSRAGPDDYFDALASAAQWPAAGDAQRLDLTAIPAA